MTEQMRPWSLKDVYDDLGTKTDVAVALDVTCWRVNKWIERRERVKCPLPIKRLGHLDVYSIEEWRGWFGRWQAKHNPDTKWTNGKPHGSGTGFFVYGRPRDE